MAIDLTSLSNAANTALALSNLVLVSPVQSNRYQPQDDNGNAFGTPLLFNFEGENTASLDSLITDHYVEDNTAIEDHIALAPEIITVNGFIGELNNVTPEALEPIRQAADRLQVINAYLPVISEAAQEAYNAAFQAYQLSQTIRRAAVSSWQSINNSGTINEIGSDGLIGGEVNQNQNKQQVFFGQIYGYWRRKTLFTVQTPWAIFKNCSLLRVRAIQGEEDQNISDFELTFKVIRFARTYTDQGDMSADSSQGRLVNQWSQSVNLGVTTPQPSISLTQAISSL